MRYVIGIDSGGTNYRLKAVDIHGRFLGSYTGVPANYHQMPQRQMMKRIENHIDCLLSQFQGKKEEAAAIVCGTTGLDSADDERILSDLYQHLPGFSCPVHIMNDAKLAHYTVTGGEGILVICGTGSIAYGRNAEGRIGRAGGWLYTILGDEGSGSWISRNALRYVGRYFDGAVQESPLVAMVQKELGLDTRDDLVNLSHRMGLQPWFAPPLAQIVDTAAAKNDEEAKRILESAANHIFHIVRDLCIALDIGGESSFKLGIWGSTLLRSPLLQHSFLRLVKEHYPKVVFCESNKEAVDGAVELALKMYERNDQQENPAEVLR